MMKISDKPIANSVLIAAVCVATLWSTVGRAEESAESSQKWDAYRVIVQRNMFSRQRGAERRQRREEQREVVSVPDPESYYRLRGIAQENGTCIAFIEDTRTNETLKLRQGASVARGSIESLDLDSIIFRIEDRTITVAIGQDLLGGQGAVTMNELMQWTPTATSTTGSETTPAAPTGDEADILKQLLERRKQELGQ